MRGVKANNASSFSIHKRIEGGATSFVLLSDEPEKMFQYPQADRRGCNIRLWIPEHHPSIVSVSTSGSKGVQRGYLHTVTRPARVSVSTSGSKGVQPSKFMSRRRKKRVSVSTSGSKGVQRVNILKVPPTTWGFSIHKRIEGGATSFPYP